MNYNRFADKVVEALRAAPTPYSIAAGALGLINPLLGTLGAYINSAGALVAPLGAAITGALAATGAITSSSASAGIGYATGAGVAATQGTSVTTTVVANGVCGTITTFAQTLGAGVDVSFTFTNSAIAANDVVVVSTKSYGGTADGIPIGKVQATAAGSCIINIHNQGAVTLDALVVLNFAVIKAVAA